MVEIEKLKSGDAFDEKSQEALDRAIHTTADAAVTAAMKHLTEVDYQSDKAARETIVETLSDAFLKELRNLSPDPQYDADGRPEVTPHSGMLRALNEITRREWAWDEVGKKAADTRTDQNEIVKAAAIAATEKLAEDYYRELRGKQAPLPETLEAPRVPSEVLVQLQARLEKANANAPDPAVQQLIKDCRKLFMGPNLTVEATQAFLEEAATALEADHGDLSGLCGTLGKSMPATSKDVPPTRLQDNIYGRVFDTKLIAGLVEAPPREVMEAMTGAKSQMAKVVENFSDAQLSQLGDKMTNSMKYMDPRFWFKKVPEVKAIVDAKGYKNVGEAVQDFLAKESTDGFDCVATPYVLVKLALALDSMDKDHVPWKEKGDKNYDTVIKANTGRQAEKEADRVNPLDKHHKTVGSGITLGHQPSADYDDQWMQAGKRPVTKNRPDFQESTLATGEVGGDETEHANVGKPKSETVQTALDHGRPFGSGVSGSTNMLLFNLKAMQDAGAQIDTKNFLLGAMMFLVYDGGHSIHEVLWTANQLDEQLGLNLGLGGDPEHPEDFVADYEAFIEKFQGDSAVALERASEAAWRGVSEYHEENSVFANE